MTEVPRITMTVAATIAANSRQVANFQNDPEAPSIIIAKAQHQGGVQT